MKNTRLFLLAGILILSSSFLHATTLADFAGTWVGQRTEFSNGQAIVLSQKTIFRYSQNSLRISATIRSGNVTLSAAGTYASDGIYSARLTYHGQILAVSSGRWRLVGKTIRINSITNQVGGSTVRTRSSTQLVNPRTIVSVSNTGSGNVALTLHRR